MLSNLSLFGQSPIGTWETIDDKTGLAKSHVEIYEQDGVLQGKIVKLINRDPDVVCHKCKGKLKGKPVVGLHIINDMKQDGAKWNGGKILDPQNGNVYKCIIWLDKKNPNKLKVRGKHWTGIYRTQTWNRI